MFRQVCLKWMFATFVISKFLILTKSVLYIIHVYIILIYKKLKIIYFPDVFGVSFIFSWGGVYDWLSYVRYRLNPGLQHIHITFRASRTLGTLMMVNTFLRTLYIYMIIHTDSSHLMRELIPCYDMMYFSGYSVNLWTSSQRLTGTDSYNIVIQFCRRFWQYYVY